MLFQYRELTQEIREESKPSGPAEATMISDNDLLLIISGDEDVDYTVPKTPYCPSTDTEEHMTEDKQNDAYENPLLYKRSKSLKDKLVRAKSELKA